MIVLALLACVDPPDREGIAIGNPPNLTARMAPPSGATVESAEIHVSEITAGCGTEVASVADIGAIDLMGTNSLPVPMNSLCVLSLGASAPMELTLRAADGREVTGRLDLSTVSVMADSAFQVDGSLVLELGSPGWLDPSILASGVTDIEPGSPEHAALVAALRSGSALFVDGNHDSQIDTTERSSGALLKASAAESASDTDSGTLGSDDTGADDPGQDQGNSGANSGDTGSSSGSSASDTGTRETGTADTAEGGADPADTGEADTGA